MDRRIFGLETEYGVTCTYRGQRRLSPDEVARYLFRRVVSWGRSSNVFLRNGARLYLDVGSAPRVRHPRVRLRRRRGGARPGRRADSRRPPRSTPRNGCTTRASPARSICSRTTPTPPATRTGVTRTTCVSRHGEFGRLADILIPFLVTRQLICGAGKVLQTPRGAVFCLSQRAEHIWEGVSSATTRSRPIINTRDEPHADAERYRRLHVIVGDSNMNEVTTLLKVGSADIVLRMIEAGVAMRDLTLENPIRAIREVVPRHHRPAQGPPGQRQGVQRAGNPAGVLRPGQRVRRAPGRATRPRSGSSTCGAGCCARSRPSDLSGVEREIDWVTKLRLLERYQARHDLALSHPGSPRWTWPTTTSGRNRGLYALLEEEGRSTGSPPNSRSSRPRRPRRRPPGPDCAASSSVTPRRSGVISTVDWVHLKLNDQAQRTVLCKDPFRAYDERVERLIASM